MNTRVEFKSAAFPKYPDEDTETVNEHCWGKRLAEFVRDELPKHGIPTEDILCEDWGWLVYLTNDDFPLWIGCGIMDEFDDAENAEDPESALTSPASSKGITQFGLFVTGEPGIFQRLFKRVDTTPAVQKVVEGLRQLLEASPEIHDVMWTE